jgi:Methylase involved in ubiquinone/menaquinone biosynthesis
VSVASVAWDWKKGAEERWLVPSEISHYLVYRWKEMGFTAFLDLGCGLGRHSLQFARAGFAVSSFDLSPEAVASVTERAAAEGLRIAAVRGDMMDLPYADSSMDCLLAYHVISHTDTEGIKKVIAEIERVLRPGGEFYLSLCSKSSRGYKDAGFPFIDANTVRKVEDGPENGIPHFFADEESIAGLFSRFRILSLQHIRDCVVEGRKYGSWHYFLLGRKEEVEAERVGPGDPELSSLIAELDEELWRTYPTKQGAYGSLNVLPVDARAIVLRLEGVAVACGCIKANDDGSTYELKRVFVKPESRGRGLSKRIVAELESWARELGASRLLLETGVKQAAAISLYEKVGFSRVPNFGPYEGNENSVCMEKLL